MATMLLSTDRPVLEQEEVMTAERTAVSCCCVFFIKLSIILILENFKILAYNTSSNIKIYKEKLYAPEGTK